MPMTSSEREAMYGAARAAARGLYISNANVVD